MASIQKRINKAGLVSYRVEVRKKGFPPQRATFKRKTDAKNWAEDTESAIREGRYFKFAEARKHTLKELIDRYIENILPTKPKARSQKQQLEWWRDEIGHYVLADVTPALVTEGKEKLQNEKTRTGKPRAPATVKRYLAALSHVFTIAVKDWNWTTDNPVSNVTKPEEPRGRTRFLSDDEIIDGEKVDGERTRLLKACRQSDNNYLYTVVVLALSTGMRQGEIMSLKWSDVDLKKGQITLFETKNKEIRVVPIAGRALESMKEHPRRLDTPLLFPSKVDKDKPMDLRNPWEKALKKAEITDFRFHDLRHSAASYLAMNGATPGEIAAVLGHKTLQMVKRYAHLSEAHTAAVVASMNARIFND